MFHLPQASFNGLDSQSAKKMTLNCTATATTQTMDLIVKSGTTGPTLVPRGLSKSDGYRESFFFVSLRLRL